MYLFENHVLQQPGWASAGIVLREVLGSSTVQGYYEPLTLLSLMLDVALGGRSDDLTVFHVTSLALHLLNTTLIIVLLYMLFGQPWVAALVGLIFGVHPLTVEPVAWVWERKTVLASFFALWCMIVYVRYTRQPGRALYGAMLGLFVLALMAKPTVTPLPVLLLLLDFWPLRRLSRRAVLEKVPFFVIAGISAIITVISTSRAGAVISPIEHPLLQIPLKFCYLMTFYFCKIVWPVNLTSVYVLPEPMALSQPLVLGGVVGTCSLFVLAVASLRWTRALLTGCLFFVLAILPTVGVIEYSWVSASDKYVYLPAVGLLIALASLLAWLWSSPSHQSPATARRLGTLAAVLILYGLESSATHRCLARWRDSEERIRYMLTLAPSAAVLHNHLANVLSERGKLDEAVIRYTEALKLDPGYADAHNNLGLALTGQGKLDEAIRHYTEAIRINPTFPEAQNNLAIALAIQGKHDEAIRHYTEAIRINPTFPETHNNLALSLAIQGKLDEAVRHYTMALQLIPAFAEAQNNLANALADQGKLEEAARSYRKAIQIKPSLSEAHKGLGMVLERQGKTDQAILEYREALRLNPQESGLRDQLDHALGQQR